MGAFLVGSESNASRIGFVKIVVAAVDTGAVVQAQQIRCGASTALPSSPLPALRSFTQPACHTSFFGSESGRGRLDR